jgi:hypothetical protein
MPRLNLVDQFERLALGGDEVVPAPCNHQPIGQPKHPISDRIAMVMIVEKPRVNIALAQRPLDGGQVHRHEDLFYTTHRTSEFRAGSQLEIASGNARAAPSNFALGSGGFSRNYAFDKPVQILQSDFATGCNAACRCQ